MRRILLLILLLSLSSVTLVAAQSGGYQGTGTVQAGAGGRASGGAYQVQGTLGQPAVTTSAGGAYAVTGGLWGRRAPVVTRPTRIYLPLLLRQHPVGPVVHPWADAPNTYAAARAVTLGDIYLDDFGLANDNDWYQFTATAGQSYRLTTGVLGARADTQLRLFTAGEWVTPTAENDDVNYPVDISSRIDWTAPADGVYYALVRNWDWQVYGAETGYQFSVTRLAAPARQTAGTPATLKPAAPGGRP